MEDPVRLRAILARTPGLMTRHLSACLIGPPAARDPLPSDLLPRLLHGPLPARTRAWLESPDSRLIDADLRWMDANDCGIVCSLDANFPTGIALLAAAPACLYVTGSGPSPGGPTLAVVGSRQATAGGKQTAHQFAADLARAGVGIVSGLAVGIDAAAHEGALAAGGYTIAVCATGLDRAYPAVHAELARRIRIQGSLVSVFPPGTPPRRHHFPIRNRLIGALSAGTLVVEAAAESGSLITAQQTRLLNRRLFAVPGSIRDRQARGCNQLIRDGATLVQQSCEILRELGFNNINQGITSTPMTAVQRRSGSSPLDNKYEMLLDAAGFEPVDIDVLAFRTGWTGHAVASMLLLLELQGRVAPQPGGRYCRLS
jgi:DNA processing protein